MSRDKSQAVVCKKVDVKGAKHDDCE